MVAGDLLRHQVSQVLVYAAQESDCQVQVGPRRPAKLRRRGRASRQECRDRGALFVGQRQPEESPYFLRTAGFQFCWTQELGAVGRQP